MTKNKRDKAFELYVNARSFWLAVGAIVRNWEESQDQKYMWPMIVNEAFCLELHLKCVRLARRRKIKRDHNVEALFDSFSKLDRQKIAKYLAAGISKAPVELDGSLDYDVASILARSKDTFPRLRYWHEGLVPSRDSKGKASNAGVGHLIAAINRRILDIKPKWETQVNRIVFLFAGQPLST